MGALVVISSLDTPGVEGENSQWLFEGNLPMTTGLPIVKLRGRGT
jgi:hypothetical protein